MFQPLDKALNGTSSPYSADSPKSTTASEQDSKTKQTAKRYLSNMKAGLVSLKNKVAAQINLRNSYWLSIFMAVYPIAKLALSIVAHFAAGAAISLPPVAAGLLIAATTLFLISLIVDISKNRKEQNFAKSRITLTLVFLAAPLYVTFLGVLFLYALANGAKEKIQKQMHSRSHARAGTIN